MKLADNRNNSGTARVKPSFRSACAKSCQRILAQIKETIFNESRNAFQAQERMLRLALNEAEAMAWETTYPHLVFPDLAMEKVQTLRAWTSHQRAVRLTSPISTRFHS